MRKTAIFTLIFLPLFSIISKGQFFFNDGQIILNNHEKKIGRIKQIDNQTIKFLEKNKKTQIYSVNDLDSYIIDSIPYAKQKISLSNNEKETFLKVISIGYLSLYEVPKGKPSSKFVIKKENENCITITNENAALELRKVIFDANDSELIEKVTKNNFRYSRSFIQTITKDYSNITKPNQKVIEPKSPFVVSFGIIGGFSSSVVTYTGYRDDPFVKANGPISTSKFTPFGISFTVNPQKTMAFNVEVLYNQYEGSRLIKYSTSVVDYTDKIYFSEKSISVPLNLKFTFLQNPFRAYIKAGPKYVFEKSVSGYIEKESSFVKSIFDYPNRSGVGFNACLGIEKRLGKNMMPMLEYRYSQHSIQDGVTKIGYNTSQQIVAGLSFSTRK